MEPSAVKHFLTIDWCSQGKRGIFCSTTGDSYWQERPWTEDEMDEILGLFSLVLDPKSIPLTEEELHEYSQWYPLAEFCNQFGYAAKKEKLE